MALRAVILCIIMAITPLFGQHTQSLYFSDPGGIYKLIRA